MKLKVRTFFHGVSSLFVYIMPKGIFKRKKGYKRRHRSQQWKDNLSQSLKGRISPMLGKKHTEETRKKIKEALKKIDKTFKNAKNLKHSEWMKKNNPRLGKTHTLETIKKMREARLKRKEKFGYINSLETREKISKSSKGKKLSEEAKRKLSELYKGDKCRFWKGGISFEPYSIDWTKTLKQSIRQRDKYICQMCGESGKYVHHIDYDKKNCNSENLITLCNSCHTKTNYNRDYWVDYFSIAKFCA